MTHLPRRPQTVASPETRESTLDATVQEIAAEKAATMARIARQLASAVQAFKRIDLDPSTSKKDRERALTALSLAAWEVAVQRDAMGLAGDTIAWMQDVHHVPSAALARMGRISSMAWDEAPTRGPDGIPPLAARLTR